VSASSDNSIKLWTLNRGLLENSLFEHSDSVLAVTDLNSNRFATGSADKTIKIWSSSGDIKKNHLIQTLFGHTSKVTSLVKLENNNLLASGSADFTIKLWDLDNFTLIQNLTGHTDSVNCLINVGQGLASGSSDGFIKIWNIATG